MQKIISSILILISLNCYSQYILKNPYHYPAAPIMSFDGVDDYISMSDIGAATIVSWEGTATPTKTNGTRIDVTKGTLWELILSDGTRWIGCEGDGDTIYDVSSNANHAKLNNITIVDFWAEKSNQNTYIYDNGYSNLGNNIVTNGGFDTDSDWVLGVGHTITGGFLNINTGSATFSRQPQTQLVTGLKYLITYSIVNYTSESAYTYIGIQVRPPIQSSAGTYTQEITFSGGDVNYYIQAGVSGFVGSLDNVSIKTSSIKYPALLDGSADVLGNPIGVPAPSKAPKIIKNGTNILKND